MPFAIIVGLAEVKLPVVSLLTCLLLLLRVDAVLLDSSPLVDALGALEGLEAAETLFAEGVDGLLYLLDAR